MRKKYTRVVVSDETKQKVKDCIIKYREENKNNIGDLRLTENFIVDKLCTKYLNWK